MDNEGETQRRRIALSHLPEALAPSYTTRSANVPIKLFEGNMVIRLLGAELPVVGVIELNWLPEPSTRFRLSSDAMFMIADTVQLILSDINLVCEAHFTHMDIGKPPNTYYGRLTKPVVYGSVTDCDCLIFHLPNFFGLFGKTLRDANYTGSWSGRLEFESNDWKVILDANYRASDLLEQLEDIGGYALTHTGKLGRVDGSPFDLKSALDLIDALYFFFSFLKGCWCGPLLPTGQIKSKNVWCLWATQKQTSWQRVRSWVPTENNQATEDLSEAFAGFMKKWTSDLWKDPIRYAIHWYVEANLKSGGLEGSIILIQTALELIGYLFLVEDSTTANISSSKFNDLHFDEKIRDLLIRMQLPTNIPSRLTALTNAATKLESVDGPDVLAKIRNTIVHPKPKHRESLAAITTQERYEAWTLGISLLELVLLHIFGYRGTLAQGTLFASPIKYARAGQ